jgi:hypothetical protein
MYDIILAHDKDLGCNGCNCEYRKTYIFKRYLELAFIPGSFYSSNLGVLFDPYDLKVNVNVNMDLIPFCRSCFLSESDSLYNKYIEARDDRRRLIKFVN